MAGQQSPKFQQALSLQKEGKLDAARLICDEILREEGERAEVLHLLGLIAYQTGNIEQAAELIGKAAALDPVNTLFHYHRGLAFQRLQNFEAAIVSYDKAIAIAPDNVDALMNRGNVLAALGRFEAAVSSYNAAAALRPNAALIYFNLGQVLRELGDFQRSADNLGKAIELNPNSADAHNHLGRTLQRLNRVADAEASFRRAIQLQPDHADALSNLGDVLELQGRTFESVTPYQQLVALQPGRADAHDRLGKAYLELGCTEDAVSSFRNALAAGATHETHSRLVFALDMLVSSDTALLQGERKRWAALFAPSMDAAPFSNRRDPERRLRVGYVSADFKMHSAAMTFGAMLTKFNSTEFEVFAYNNASSEGDAITKLFRDSVTHWRDIAGLSDDEVAAKVREDGIDILVDLSGHSPGNRLHVFAKKPAPIQISAWGFNTGTGLKAIDVIVGDAIGIPETDKHLFAERVRHLPSTFGAFFPSMPDVNPLPAYAGSKLVFGSFNRLCKVSDEALKLWARVLAAVPESVLMIKVVELDDPRQKERILAVFAAAGVDRRRLILAGKTGWYDHMAAYNRVDIALDPFPHTGGVTTLEGLAMGVPVITLSWPTIVGRLSTSFLTTLGMTDWIATTPDQYVEIAVRKARDLPALNEVRQNLRAKMRDSILGDAKAYANAVEQEYRHLWKEWCART